MIRRYRLYSQKILGSDFLLPEDVVSWMGAVQAQESNMSKWAVGMRTLKPSLSAVNSALDNGRILRLHILRPTWHYVVAEDIRWMAALSCRRIKAAYESRGKELGLGPEEIAKGASLVLRYIDDSEEHPTRADICEGIVARGVRSDKLAVDLYIACGEADGLICSGRQRDGRHTYALVEKRVPPRCRTMIKDESLAMLAVKYFRSHGPATLTDFIWWSGMTATDCKQAVHLAGDCLVKEKFCGVEYILHSECLCGRHDSRVRLLPSYDEYLISYKDRTAAIEKEKSHLAFNNYGIFQPVVLHKGRITGNWKRSQRKGRDCVDTVFFTDATLPDTAKISRAERDLLQFLSR